MHEHVSASHKKDSFNKHLKNYMFHSAEVGSSVKNQVLAVLFFFLKKKKKKKDD